MGKQGNVVLSVETVKNIQKFIEKTRTKAFSACLKVIPISCNKD